MAHIMIAGNTLEQYLKQLSSSPDSFRPANCPGCSKKGLWHHGSYLHYPDRSTTEHKALNPVPILRFQMSSLQQDMLMPANMYGTEALAFMVDSANNSIADPVRTAHQAYQQRAFAIKANDWPFESLASTDA